MNWKTFAIVGILATLLIAMAISKPLLAITTTSDDDKDKEKDKGKKEECKNKISMEEAINASLKYLKENYGDFNYTLIKSEAKDKKYEFKFTNQTHVFEIEVNACNGEIIEAKVEEMKIVTKPNLISQSQAIDIAINFLKQNFGEKNYTLLKIELEGVIYEIKMTDGANIYEIKIDGLNGKIIKFEVKGINQEIEKKMENELKVEINTLSKIVKEGLKIEIEKRNTVLKINFVEKGNLTKTELEITLIFDKLIEFNDSNLNGIFDNNDAVISFINLHSLNWITNVSNITDSQGNLVEYLIEQKANLTNQGKVLLTYHIIPSTETFKILEQNITVNIYKVKFDVYIEKFPWKNDNSLLALQLKFNNEFEYKDKNLKAKFKTIGNTTPFFEWGGDAYADGNLVKVNATIDKNQVYLTYPHFTQTLKHDPSLGYEVYSALGATTGTTTTATVHVTVTGTETSTQTITKTTTQTITKTSPTTVTSIMLSLFRDALFLIISLIIMLTVIIALIYRTRKIKKELGI
jgi:uncharacterized membrane protein YkoI